MKRLGPIRVGEILCDEGGDKLFLVLSKFDDKHNGHRVLDIRTLQFKYLHSYYFQYVKRVA